MRNYKTRKLFTNAFFVRFLFLLVLITIFIPYKSTNDDKSANVTANYNGTKADYYVSSTSGSDTNDGSITSPWKTIQKAADTVKPGDTVYVRGGNYNEKVTMKTSGTMNAYITFINYDGETPIINGENQKVSNDDLENALILIPGKSYIKVIGFNVTNYVSTNKHIPAGIRVTGTGKNVEIRNCKVYEIKTTYSESTESRNAYGIAVHGTNGESSLDGIVIDSCEVYDCILGESESVVLNGNVTNFTVSKNKIHDNDNIGIDFIGYEDTSSENDYVRNGVCFGNEVWNISSGSNKQYKDNSADGIYVDGGSSIIVEKNKVWNSDIGIEIASEHKNKATDDVIVRNNLVYNSNTYGICMGGFTTSKGKATNIKIYNNTVYNNNINMNIQKNCQFNSNFIKNNIFYEGTAFSGDENNIIISNNITSNPKFVKEGVDFNLQANSPAVNAGVNDKAIDSVDMDEKKRILGEKVDCGCYEKQ